MLTKWSGLASALSLVVCVSACQSPPAPQQSGAPQSAPQAASLPTDAERAQMEQRIQEYFKKAANLPAGVTLKVGEFAAAPVAGLLTATLEASNGQTTQKVPLLLTRDGRYAVQGQLTDLSVDPYMAVMQKISLKDEPVRGNPSSSVTIVEYSDFQCPFCSRAYQLMEDQVMKDYGDKVRFVFKNFPLTSIHPWAESGALAVECARQQSPEAFWKVYDFLFKNQSSLSVDTVKEKTQAVIKDAGLNVDAFGTCFDTKAGLPAVKADQDEANALGVRSTPTFFVNGRKLEGALPYEQFKTMLDELLNPAAAGADTGRATPGAAQPG